MKSLMLSDVHIDESNAEEIKLIIRQGIQFSKENNIKSWICLGDWFKERSSQKLLVLLSFGEILNMLSDSDISLYTFPGNHDKTDAEDEKSYLSLFRNIGIKKHHFYDVESCEDGKWYFIPFFSENGSFLRRLTNINKEAAKYNGKKFLFLHQSINGVKNNDGTLVDDGLKGNLFKNFDKVFVGHYHNYQKLSNKIIYIGSLKPHNYGEDNDKGFWLFDDKTGDLERVQTNFKKYRKILIDLEKTNKSMIESFREKLSNSGDNVRFVFRGTEDELAMIDAGYFEKVGIEVKKENKNILRAVEYFEETKSLQFNKSDLKINFLKYCNKNKIVSNKLSLGLNYFKKL
ncbi:MAG TPA: metallophosphoesterase [Candidatus Kapabacteria bacterium]|nr:metallophosphoesterase [Candidatus Kapabacteria bacterium]